MRTLCHPDYLLIHSKGSMLGPGNHIKYALAAQGQKFLLIAWVASIFPKSTKGQEQHNSEAGLHRILVCILHVYCQSPISAAATPSRGAGWGSVTLAQPSPHRHTHAPAHTHRGAEDGCLVNLLRRGGAGGSIVSQSIKAALGCLLEQQSAATLQGEHPRRTRNIISQVAPRVRSYYFE